jgi:hypothetical protein
VGGGMQVKTDSDKVKFPLVLDMFHLIGIDDLNESKNTVKSTRQDEIDVKKQILGGASSSRSSIESHCDLNAHNQQLLLDYKTELSRKRNFECEI